MSSLIGFFWTHGHSLCSFPVFFCSLPPPTDRFPVSPSTLMRTNDLIPFPFSEVITSTLFIAPLFWIDSLDIFCKIPFFSGGSLLPLLASLTGLSNLYLLGELVLCTGLTADLANPFITPPRSSAFPSAVSKACSFKTPPPFRYSPLSPEEFLRLLMIV